MHRRSTLALCAAFALCLQLMVLTLSNVAQAQARISRPSGGSGGTTSAPAAEAQALSQRLDLSGRSVNLHLYRAELIHVMRLLLADADISIRPDPELSGTRITVAFDQIDLERALSIILVDNQLSMWMDGGTLRIGQRSKYELAAAMPQQSTSPFQTSAGSGGEVANCGGAFRRTYPVQPLPDERLIEFVASLESALTACGQLTMEDGDPSSVTIVETATGHAHVERRLLERERGETGRIVSFDIITVETVQHRERGSGGGQGPIPAGSELHPGPFPGESTGDEGMDRWLAIMGKQGEVSIKASQQVSIPGGEQRSVWQELSAVHVPVRAGSGRTVTEEAGLALRLDLSPVVNPDGSITVSMKVLREILRRTAGTARSPAPNGAPSGSRRLQTSADEMDSAHPTTRMLVQDGETFYLGGIFIVDREVREEPSRLSSIPLVRGLSTPSDPIRERREISILLTPRIIAPTEQ